MFIPPENQMISNKVQQIHYSTVIDRHRTHLDSISAKISFSIITDLDKQYEYEGLTWTLREIIYGLDVKDPDNPLFDTNLFCSVDYIQDCSQIWLNNKRGPSSAGVIFTYYTATSNEATKMINGLGRYIYHEFSKRLAYQMMSTDHFTATSGWKYDKITGLFRTPEEKRMSNNINFDNNLPIINKLKTFKNDQQEDDAIIALHIDKSNLLKLPNKNKTNNTNNVRSSSPSTIPDDNTNITKLAQIQKLKELDAINKDPDLNPNSITNGNNTNLESTLINNNPSTTSSLTDQSISTRNTTNTLTSDSTIKSNNTSNTITITPTLLKQLEGNTIISESELATRMKSYQALQYQKAQQKLEHILKQYLSAKENPSNSKSNQSEQLTITNDKQNPTTSPTHNTSVTNTKQDITNRTNIIFQLILQHLLYNPPTTITLLLTHLS